MAGFPLLIVPDTSAARTTFWIGSSTFLLFVRFHDFLGYLGIFLLRILLAA